MRFVIHSSLFDILLVAGIAIAWASYQLRGRR